jgi:NAD(P)-dependent dehydrogenase (short-subunit alcohol dehydrogenase family)
MPPVLDTARAAAVLPMRPAVTLWTCLAQLVQEQVQQRRRSDLLPPVVPRMPAALVAVETAARPLEGKVAVLTGATAGIGAATALLLARLGAQVVGVGRNAAAGAALCTRIDRIGSAPARFIVADLAEMAEVRRLADTLCADFPRIDLLINNAGAVFPERSENAEGNERTLALNLLAPLLLSRLLAGPLTAAGGHVINLTSEAHRNWPVDLADLQAEFDYKPMAAYGRAKSGLILITYALAELARDSGVRFNAINPGAVRTEILTQLGDGMETEGLGPQAVQRIESMRARRRQQLLSPEHAALHIVNLAVDPDWSEAQGLYLDKDAAVASAPHTCDPAIAERLWLLCAELVDVEP